MLILLLGLVVVLQEHKKLVLLSFAYIDEVDDLTSYLP